MPTINCTLRDINKLSGLNLSVRDLDEKITIFKGELKEYDRITDELKIEISDTNRPDLWSVEGIARQLRFCLSATPPKYPWFTEEMPPFGTFIVDPAMADIRPYAAGFAVKNLDVTEDVLIAAIQIQEKLTDNLGHHRQTISIGIYDLNRIKFPVRYTAVGLDDIRFIPLDWEEPATPRRILAEHPKGIEYRYTLEGFQKVPMLIDATGEILSFPPIINSRSSGEVKPGRRDLFIEATGTALDPMLLALNILAVSMADRGGQIIPVTAQFPSDTKYGRSMRIPFAFNQSPVNLHLETVNHHLGRPFTTSETESLLRKYGYETERKSDTEISVYPMEWRQDILHPVDIIEDIAIAAGYDSFEPEMPSDYTIGDLNPLTIFGDRIRDTVLAFGFEEIISNILCNRDDFAMKMRDPDRIMIEIANPMSDTFSAIRDRILPSLLRVERDSSSALYPHRIFETGEVTVPDSSTDTGCKTRLRTALLLADKVAELSTVQSYLDTLLFQLGLESTLQPVDRPEFIPGRSGTILVNGTPAGWIGELHPEVLENFEITMPCAAFEIDLMTLHSLLYP